MSRIKTGLVATSDIREAARAGGGRVVGSGGGTDVRRIVGSGGGRGTDVGRIDGSGGGTDVGRKDG
jgi:hypothetical protein